MQVQAKFQRCHKSTWQRVSRSQTNKQRKDMAEGGGGAARSTPALVVEADAAALQLNNKLQQV